MRVSMHNGRQGLARHNDRDFEVAHAEHIDASRSEKNKYWQIPEYAGMKFREMELAFYTDTFEDGLKARNKRYLEQRHPERCKSVESLLHGAKTKPEEQLLTIGNRNDGVDVEAFAKCLNDYVKKMDEWNHKHGSPFRLLDAAVHADEKGAVHAHLRRVWVAPDADGNLMPNQSRALQRAGVKRPNLNAKESRTNNAKVSFDKFARTLWQQVCREHGFEIETKPVKPDRRHMKIGDFIRADNASAERERQNAEARINKLWKEVEGLEARKSEMARREKSLKSREADLMEWQKSLDLREREFTEWENERETDLEKREKTIEGQEALLKKIVADLPQDLLKIAKSDKLKIKKNVINKIDADLKKLNMPSVIDAIIAQNAPVAGNQIPEEKNNKDNDWKMMTIFDREEEERKAVLSEI